MSENYNLNDSMNSDNINMQENNGSSDSKNDSVPDGLRLCVALVIGATIGKILFNEVNWTGIIGTCIAGAIGAGLKKRKKKS